MSDDPNAAADAAIARAVGQAVDAKALDVIRRIDLEYPAASMMRAYLDAQPANPADANARNFREHLSAWCDIMRDARDLLKGGLAK